MLSCNIPLLVWTVSSLNQEAGANYQDIPAKTNSYWDNRCGESFTNMQDIPSIFNKFIKNINAYKPREFILDTLSPKICAERLKIIIGNVNT